MIRVRCAVRSLGVGGEDPDPPEAGNPVQAGVDADDADRDRGVAVQVVLDGNAHDVTGTGKRSR
jgi:hypothetical protein